METPTRTYVLNVVLASVPDLVVCWFVARLTNSGWSGFFIALVVLQAIYFFFWFKFAAWSWLVFLVFRKRKMAKTLEKWLIENDLPVPDEYTTDLEDYLSEISSKDELTPAVRVKAAHELGTLAGLTTARQYSLILQLTWAASIALKRYARRANGKM